MNDVRIEIAVEALGFLFHASHAGVLITSGWLRCANEAQARRIVEIMVDGIQRCRQANGDEQ